MRNINIFILVFFSIITFSCKSNSNKSINPIVVTEKQIINESLDKDLPDFPDTKALTKDYLIGTWVYKSKLGNVDTLKFDFFGKPYYSAYQKKALEEGLTYVENARSVDDPEPVILGYVKMFQFKYWKFDRERGSYSDMGPSENIDIVAPGIVKFSEFPSNFSLKFTNRSRIVINENFIFTRVK